MSQVRVWVIPKTLKMVITDPQPVLVIMSLSKGNGLAIKKAKLAHTLYNRLPDKSGIIKRPGCLIR